MTHLPRSLLLLFILPVFLYAQPSDYDVEGYRDYCVTAHYAHCTPSCSSFNPDFVFCNGQYDCDTIRLNDSYIGETYQNFTTLSDHDGYTHEFHARIHPENGSLCLLVVEPTPQYSKCFRPMEMGIWYYHTSSNTAFATRHYLIFARTNGTCGHQFKETEFEKAQYFDTCDNFQFTPEEYPLQDGPMDSVLIQSDIGDKFEVTKGSTVKAMIVHDYALAVHFTGYRVCFSTKHLLEEFYGPPLDKWDYTSTCKVFCVSVYDMRTFAVEIGQVKNYFYSTNTKSYRKFDLLNPPEPVENNDSTDNDGASTIIKTSFILLASAMIALLY